MPSLSTSDKQLPPHSPVASSVFPKQSHSPTADPCTHIRKRHRDRCKCQGIQRAHALVHVVANPICVDVKQTRAVALSKDIHTPTHSSTSSRCHRRRHQPHTHLHTRQRRQVGRRCNCGRRQECRCSHTRRFHLARCRCRRRQEHRRTRPRRRRCRRHRRQLSKRRHTRPRRQVGCHCNRSHRPGCSHNTLVDVARTVADATGVKRTYALIQVVADAVAIGVAEQAPPPRPRRQVGCHCNRRSPAGMFAQPHS